MELRSEIVIDAAPSDVWKVLTDFPAYAEWNPYLSIRSGEASMGARLSIELSSFEGRRLAYAPTIVVLDEPRELRWRGNFVPMGLLRGEHFYRLIGEQSRTRFVHGEDVEGALVKVMSSAVTQLARGLVLMNQALGRRVASIQNRGDGRA